MAGYQHQQSPRLLVVGFLSQTKALGFGKGPAAFGEEGTARCCQESRRCQPLEKQASGRDVSADLHPRVAMSLVVNGWTKKLIEESERATWRGAAAGSGEAEINAISKKNNARVTV